MPQSFQCPSCGGPLDYDSGADLTIPCPFCGTVVVVPEELRRGAPSASSPSADSMAHILGHVKEFSEIVRLVQEGNQIEAIKLYRQITDVGLREAKDAIDKIAAGESVTVASYTVSSGQPPSIASRRDQAEQIATLRVNQLLKDGNKIEATRSSPWGCIIGLIAVAVVAALLWFAFSANQGDNSFAASIRRLLATNTPTSTPTSRPAPTRVPTSTPVPTPTSEFARPHILLGCSGTGQGCFEDARSIGVDGAGNIYVGEYTGGRVQVFDPRGKFIIQWGIGDRDTDLDSMAVDRQGVVYAVSDGNIYRYEGATGKLLGQIKYSGGQGFQDVAVTADGGLVASWNRDWQGGLFVNFRESQDDIVVFDSAGRVAGVFPKALSKIGGGHAELDTEIAVDRQGNIYATGLLNPAIYKFMPDGKFVRKFGQDQEIHFVTALAVDSQGRVFVASGGDILIFDSDGRYMGLIDYSPEDMVFNEQNELLILDRPQVIKFVLNR